MKEQYQDKEWLKKKYLKEKLTMNNIAKECEVSESYIFKLLRRYNISCRSRSEAVHLAKANHCNLTQGAIEWINGELLGDGCLNSRSNCSSNFQYSSKYSEYIQYVSDTLKSFGIKQRGKIRKKYHKNLNCYSYHYSSLAYEELSELKKKWYLKGKKIIPKDLKLTPITLRQHYIGDGYLRHSKYRKPNIRLGTYAFLISDVGKLVKQLINLGFKTTRWASNEIYISTESTKQFINYIGKCPVSCYKYKFDYLRRSEV